MKKITHIAILMVVLALVGSSCDTLQKLPHPPPPPGAGKTPPAPPMPNR